MEKMKQIVKSPEDIFFWCKNYFTKDRQFIFKLTFIFGILTHFLLLSHLIWSPDGLLNGIHYTAGRL